MADERAAQPADQPPQPSDQPVQSANDVPDMVTRAEIKLTYFLA